MSSKVLKSAEKKILAHIEKIAKKYKSAQLDVGIFENAKYPNGEYVATVAFKQEFGSGKIPARPFFRPAIAQHSSQWGVRLAEGLKKGYGVNKTLNIVGIGIEDDIHLAIKDVTSPALSPVTLMMRKHRKDGFTLSEAYQRLAEGESTSGVNDKPLMDTMQMFNSISHQVKDD